MLSDDRKSWVWAPLLTQATRYGSIGMINTLVGLSVIFLALSTGASDVGANLLGYSIALLVSFSLNRNWTFAHRGSLSKSFARFVTVLAVAYCCNLAVMLVSHRLLGINVYLAQILGVGIYAVVGFLGSRKFAFA